MYIGGFTIFGANTGIDATSSKMDYNGVQITNCNIGQRLFGLAEAQGNLTFSGNTIDSQVTEDGEGDSSSNRGGSRWNTSSTGNQNLPVNFGEFVHGAGASINLDSGSATDAGAGVTINKMACVVTSQSLSTAAGSKDSITVTNSLVTATSIISCSVQGGSYTTGIPYPTVRSIGAGSFILDINNTHPSAALNGTVVVQLQIASA
jgi:hypothetical protein